MFGGLFRRRGLRIGWPVTGRVAAGLVSLVVLVVVAGVLLSPLVLVGKDRQLTAMLVGTTGGVLLMYIAPHAFPVWRTTLTPKERRHLVVGSVSGILGGVLLGFVVALLRLPEGETLLLRVPGSLLIIGVLTLAGGILGGALATYWIPSFPDKVSVSLPRAG